MNSMQFSDPATALESEQNKSVIPTVQSGLQKSTKPKPKIKVNIRPKKNFTSAVEKPVERLEYSK